MEIFLALTLLYVGYHFVRCWQRKGIRGAFKLLTVFAGLGVLFVGAFIGMFVVLMELWQYVAGREFSWAMSGELFYWQIALFCGHLIFCGVAGNLFVRWLRPILRHWEIDLPE